MDGTTSSLVLQSTPRLLGAGDDRLPHPRSLRRRLRFVIAAAAAEDGIGLIITADIGVRDHDVVQRAAERGVDVIICDHHLPDGASCSQRCTCGPVPTKKDVPIKQGAGCGGSLAQAGWALLESHPRQEAILRSMLKVAAIGTVADVADLDAENRAIVAHGIQGRRAGHVPGLHALLEVAGVQGEVTLKTWDFA